jgi:hypothetical protein
MGIEWGPLPISLVGHYIVNHVPQGRAEGRRPYKSHAQEVRDGLLTSSSIADLLDSILILNRWDVLVLLRPSTDPEILASALSNLDNYILVDASTTSRVFPSTSTRTYDPPYALIQFPLHLLASFVLSSVSAITPILSHQEVKPGSLLVCLQDPHAARPLYGLRLYSPQGSILITSGDGSLDSRHEAQLNLPPNAPLDIRRHLLSSPPPPILSTANLLAASSDVSMTENPTD